MKKELRGQQAAHPPLGWRLLEKLCHLFRFIKIKTVQKDGEQLRKLTNPRLVIMTDNYDHMDGYIADDYGRLTGFPITFRRCGHVIVDALLKEHFISPEEAAILNKQIEGMVWLPAENLYRSNN
jgi:hypothetical protein